MNFIKRHKIKLIILLIFIILFVVSIVALLNLLYPDSKKSVYGNRLQGIEKVNVSEQEVTAIKDKISESSFVDNVDYDLKGRLITFSIEVKADTNKAEAKKVVGSITEILNKDVQDYYDIQVMITENKEETKDEEEKKSNYPIFAYKHKTRESFKWTNN